MRIDSLRTRGRAIAGAVWVAGMLTPANAFSSTIYGYDEVGQVRSALYDNGACLTYVYDQAGNRTSQTTTIGGTREDPTWGTGYWGCFPWTPP
jgi:YD repeat-containing protein